MIRIRTHFYIFSCIVFLILGFYIANTLQEDVTQSSFDTLTQVSTIDTLYNGVYDGVSTIKKTKEYGDFGIGTFDSLDGELIMLNNRVYRVSFNGSVKEVPDDETTPFAQIIEFDNDADFILNETYNITSIEAYIDEQILTENIFYGIKIEGNFSYIKTRAPEKQKKPYPNLTKALENQAIFEMENVSGTIVGYRSPEYIKGIGVPGYHLHFITDDKTKGGHVLAFNLNSGILKLDYVSEFKMILPAENSDFYTTDLTKDVSEELEKVER